MWTQCPGPSSATPSSPAGTVPTAHIQQGTQGSERARRGLVLSGQGVPRFRVPVPADGARAPAWHISWASSPHGEERGQGRWEQAL